MLRPPSCGRSPRRAYEDAAAGRASSKVIEGTTTVEEVLRVPVLSRRIPLCKRHDAPPTWPIFCSLWWTVARRIRAGGAREPDPQIRVDGASPRLARVPRSSAPQDTQRLAYSVLNEGQKQKFEEETSSTSPSASRVSRAFAVTSTGSAARSGARSASSRTRSARLTSWLGCRRSSRQLADRPEGLILRDRAHGVWQVDDAGAMIDKINNERHAHIMTIEDPIEFVHPHKQCLVEPARGLRRHAVVHEGAQVDPPAGPGRGARRRDARPGDDRGSADDRGDRALDVGHLAHELVRADDEPHHRRASPRPSRRRSGHSSRSCSRGLSRRPSFPRWAADG